MRRIDPLPAVKLPLFALACALAVLAPACQGTKRLPPQVEQEEADAIIGGSTTRLLERIRTINPAEEIWLAYAGVENLSSTPLGSAKADTDQSVTKTLVNSHFFRMISEQQVEAAKRASGVSRTNELTLQEPRSRFLGELTNEGRVPDYILFGTLTSIDSEGDDGRRRRFRLSLQMMNSSSGEIVAQEDATFTKDPR